MLAVPGARVAWGRLTLARAVLVLGLAIACLVAQPSGAAEANVSALPRLAVPGDLRVVSYYPADAGWTLMWDRWRPERISADLDRLRGLNANTVRVVVATHFFGYPEPDSARLRQLRTFVELAARSGLHVHFTLFDWWYEYRQVATSKRWARAVLEPYVGDPRVAFVELKNELSPTNPAAIAWAGELLPWLRTLLRGQTPVTLSVGGVAPVADLRALVSRLPARSRPDFFDVHYLTGEAERAVHVFRALRQIAGRTPLWVGEVGYPSSTRFTGFAGIPLTDSAQEAAQAHYHRLCAAALAGLGLPPPGIWALDDFVAGAIPQAGEGFPEQEHHFGLFRTDGTAKPAAATIRRLFAGRAETGFNGGFEQAVRAEDGTAVPAVWGSVGELRLVHDRATARTGTAAARIDGPRGVNGTFLATPVLGDLAGTALEATTWVRGRGGTVRLGLVWFASNGRVIGRRWASIAADRRWRRAAVAQTAPARAAYVRVEIHARELTGPAWVDDVAVVSRP